MGDGMDMCYSVKVVEYKAASNQEAEKTVNKFTDVVQNVKGLGVTIARDKKTNRQKRQ